MTNLLEYLKLTLQPYLKAKRWWVACSGGLDSMVLLDVLNELASEINSPPLAVIHIDHGLQLASTSWSTHIKEYCDLKHIAFKCYFLSPNPTKQTGIELWARNERYNIFEHVLKDGEVLMMAHHANDQAETFLWHALRGAGLDGLSGIPVSRTLGKGVLFRPFLKMQKSMLVQYQQEKKLPFVEDPSNADVSFTRNKLRHDVIPMLEKNWPHTVTILNKNAEILSQQNLLLTKYLKPVFINLLSNDGLTLSACKLNQLDIAEKLWCLRYWFRSSFVSIPAQSQLLEILRQLVESNHFVFNLNAEGDTISFCRFNDKLYLFKGAPPKAENQRWNYEQPLKIIGYPLIIAKSIFSKKQLEHLTAECIDVHFGEKGETIKKFWQTRQVPSWCRSSLPIFYQGGHRLHEVDYTAIYKNWHCCFDVPNK